MGTDYGRKKKYRSLIILILFLLMILMSAVSCANNNGSLSNAGESEVDSSEIVSLESSQTASLEKTESSSEFTNDSAFIQEEDTIATGLPENEAKDKDDSTSIEEGSETLYEVFVSEENGGQVAKVPEYNGESVISVNGNKPLFTDAEITKDPFENYSPLDELGRCGTAFANISTETIPEDERGPIGAKKPSGWHTVKYAGIDGNYLYNRCHLIAYSLAGENDNECNLITGTRYLNVISQLPYELQVYDYVRNTGNHVLYRVTPYFAGNELVARGILIEAMSVEDSGGDICFCVFCYNNQPGIEIDYSSGESRQTEIIYMSSRDDSDEKEKDASDGNVQLLQPELESPKEQIRSAGDENNKNSGFTEQTYILNTNTRRFHYTWCDSVNEMKEKNKQEYKGDREELIADGYRACGRCNP